MNKYDFIEFANRKAFSILGAKYDGSRDAIIIVIEDDLRPPTKLDFLKAYLTLAIPAAMLARVTRFITGRKGTPLENFCMKHYYDQSVKLLAKDSK